MRAIEEIEQNKHLSNLHIKRDGERIAIVGKIHFIRWKGTVIFDNGEGVEHVSISPSSTNIIPNWYELVELKRIFWRPDEEAIQFIPKDSEYVNVMKNCLHLWKADVETRFGNL